MAAPSWLDSPYKKDVTHNLGYKPLIKAYVWISSYALYGWYQLPVYYYDREVEDGMVATVDRRVDYEHVDDNTIRFYGQKDMEINVTLFMEPRKDAWYE